jgi:hypothetical protein
MDDFDHLKTSSMGQHLFSVALHANKVHIGDSYALESKTYADPLFSSSAKYDLKIEEKQLNTDQYDLKNSLLNYDKRLERFSENNNSPEHLQTTPKDRKKIEAEIKRQEITQKIEELKMQLKGTNDYIHRSISRNSSRSASPNNS